MDLSSFKWDYVIFFLIFILSGSIHEFAHAFSAYRQGDETARANGRMTINPLYHIDIFGSIIFPVILILTNAGILFGWMKPVPVNTSNLRRPESGNAIVSFAGPFSNLMLAVLLGLAYKIITITDPSLLMIADGSSLSILGLILYYGIVINFVLMMFNLLPVPPLDGGHIVRFFLPSSWKSGWDKLYAVGPILLVIVLFTGVLSYIQPVLRFLTSQFTSFDKGLDITTIVLINAAVWGIIVFFISRNKPYADYQY